MLWEGVLAGPDQVVRVMLPADGCKTGLTRIEPALPGARAPDGGGAVRAVGLVNLDMKTM